MAYSNWGSFVYKNGERQKDREDVAVFNTDEATYPTGYRIFVNLLKNKEKYGKEGEGRETPWHEHSHHAVLGSGPVRLCAYKCHAELFVMQPDGEVKRIELPDLCSADGEIRDASLYYFVDEEKYGKEKKEQMKLACGSYYYSIRHFDGNMIELTLKEPDGTVWTSKCGYCFGAGWTD